MHPTFHIEYEYRIRIDQNLCLVVLYLTLQIHLCLVVIIPYTSTPQIHLCLVVLHLTLHIQLCFYTSSCEYDCVFTHHLNPIVSSRAQPSLLKQSERVVTLKCVLHVFSKLSNHYCGSEVRKRQRTLLFRLSRRRRQEQHDFAFASCISQIGFMYQSNISGTSWRSSLWTSLTHLAMAKQPDVQLEGMSLKHDHPYNVPSIPCY